MVEGMHIFQSKGMRFAVVGVIGVCRYICNALVYMLMRKCINRLYYSVHALKFVSVSSSMLSLNCIRFPYAYGA
jgi:hypothetical protein